MSYTFGGIIGAYGKHTAWKETSFAMRHAIKKLAGILFCIGACVPAPVTSALPISLLDTTFTPGAGYGIDSGPNGEKGGKLLDVFFASTAAPTIAASRSNPASSTEKL
jgi:hypothetical protein